MFVDSKNACFEREAHFEIKKIENTLRCPLLFEKMIDFFCVLTNDKIIKQALCFTSKPTSEKRII